MLRIRNIVWGVRELQPAIEFWTEALGYRLREEPSDDWASLVATDDPGGPVFALMLTSSAKPHRHHLDFTVDDVDAEIDRLVALGAERVPDWEYEEDADYVVLRDPEGNTFCLIEA
jgi:catechol 2,3-dioxygenase-like lactoylglutathione lyase family enzyme